MGKTTTSHQLIDISATAAKRLARAGLRCSQDVAPLFMSDQLDSDASSVSSESSGVLTDIANDLASPGGSFSTYEFDVPAPHRNGFSSVDAFLNGGVFSLGSSLGGVDDATPAPAQALVPSTFNLAPTSNSSFRSLFGRPSNAALSRSSFFANAASSSPSSPNIGGPSQPVASMSASRSLLPMSDLKSATVASRYGFGQVHQTEQHRRDELRRSRELEHRSLFAKQESRQAQEAAERAELERLLQESVDEANRLRQHEQEMACRRVSQPSAFSAASVTANTSSSITRTLSSGSLLRTGCKHAPSSRMGVKSRGGVPTHAHASRSRTRSTLVTRPIPPRPSKPCKKRDCAVCNGDWDEETVNEFHHSYRSLPRQERDTILLNGLREGGNNWCWASLKHVYCTGYEKISKFKALLRDDPTIVEPPAHKGRGRVPHNKTPRAIEAGVADHLRQFSDAETGVVMFNTWSACHQHYQTHCEKNGLKAVAYSTWNRIRKRIHNDLVLPREGE